MVAVVPGDRILSVEQVAEKVSLSRRSIYNRLSTGEFPQPVKLGAATRWRESVIDKWIAEVMDGSEHRFSALVVASPNTGRKETICVECCDPADLVEGGPPVFISQPNRADYATETTYKRAAKTRFSCARCKAPFEAAS